MGVAMGIVGDTNDDGQDMLKFNEQQKLLISFVLLVQFASPGNGMGTGRSFHLKRRRVNPPAVDEATSLW